MGDRQYIPRIENKIALITGAARGIGKAVSELFALEGATVILSDIEDELGESTCSIIGGLSEYLHLDVSCESDWDAAKNYIQERYGRLDILVNNAGITGFLETEGPFDPENFRTESWRKVHQVNIDGVAFGCRSAIELMKSSAAASIINIS